MNGDGKYSFGFYGLTQKISYYMRDYENLRG
jgi:hypothetical protein